MTLGIGELPDLGTPGTSIGPKQVGYSRAGFQSASSPSG
jgi:hypothetical protein